jgi:hypothetical protein
MKEAFGYDADFYAWTQEQAEQLRKSRPNSVDWERLAEEIEDLGRSEKRGLVKRLTRLLSHLLKWQYQPSHNGGSSWRLTIKEQRKKLKDLLEDNPSLNANFREAITRAYEYAVLDAAKQTRLDENVFPKLCPWSDEQVMDETFFPNENPD